MALTSWPRWLALAMLSAAISATPTTDGSAATVEDWQRFGPYGGSNSPYYGGSGGSPFGGGSSNPYAGGGGGGGGFGGGMLGGISVQTALHYRTIHGILASVAIVVLFPVGSILMRIVPGRFAIWAHAISQVLAFLVFVAGAALGIYLAHHIRLPFGGGSLFTNSSTNVHPIMGVVTLVTLFFQPILGFIHHARFKRLGRRTIWSHMHLWNGRIGITVGIVNGGLGLRLARASHRLVVIYAVVAAIIWFFWFVIAVFSEFRRYRRGRNAAAVSSGRTGAPGMPPISSYQRNLRSNGAPQMTAANAGSRDSDSAAAPLRPLPGSRHSPKVRPSLSRGSVSASD